MRIVNGLAAVLMVVLPTLAKDILLEDELDSTNILPKNFKPPQVFKNTNLVRNINLEKGYVKETINVVIENTDKNSQTEYFIPFEASTISKIGGFTAKDKNAAIKGSFKTEVVEYDSTRYLLRSNTLWP